LYVEHFGFENVTHSFKDALRQVYPSEYYFENCLLKLLLKPSLYIANKNCHVVFQSSKDDAEFIAYINPKYEKILSFADVCSGGHKSFSTKMQKLNRFLNDHYALRYEKIMVPTTIQSNFFYEIVNREHKENLDEMEDAFAENLQFCTDEVIRSVGSISLRPKRLPLASKSQMSMDFPYNDMQNYKYDDWIVVAFDEIELFDKNKSNSSFCHTFVSLIPEKLMSALDIFHIEDFFEHVNIIFLSPRVLNSLKWIVNEDLQNGLFATNQNQEIVAKMITWKQDYYGSLESGLEKPKVEGVALLIKQNQLNLLKPFFGEDFGKQVMKKQKFDKYV